MIEHELLLLGLLKESPKHGYEIKKKIKEILALFAGMDLKSIYYPLEVLEKSGLVEKHANQQGKRPQRFVYKLTSKGLERFHLLLSNSFLELKRPEFNLDLSLYFLDEIEPEIAKRRLRGRMRMLNKLTQSIREMLVTLKEKKNSALYRIIEHNSQMLQAEVKFLSSLIETLK